MESSDKLNNFMIRQYSFGLGEGISWTNVWMKSNAGIRLYCPPGKLVLNEDNYFDIAKRYVEGLPYKADHPFGWLLTTALSETFPCN